jgi:hypothetical protein
MMRTPRRLIGMLIAAVALAALTPASASALGFANLSAAPTNTQAGAHSDFTISMGFTGGQVKDLTIGLPPGEVGDPTATPMCSQADFDAASCPTNTAVGDVSATATILGIVGPVPVSGNLYNFSPLPGEPARFAIILHPLGIGLVPAIKLQSAVQLRTSDYGLTTIINSIPNTTLLPGDTTITSQTITLYGSGHGLSKPFARNPTSCTQHTTTFSAVPYSGANASGSANFTPTNCGALDFSPSFSAEVGGPGQTGPGRIPTTVITSIDQDVDEAGLVKAQVAVPANDLAADANLLGTSCLPLDFRAGACAANTVVGSAIATSPLLSQPIAGNVMMVSNGSPVPDIGLDLNGQLHLLLTGSLTLGEVVTFDGLPDIPIAHFQLTFTPQPGLLTANRDLCAPPPPLFHADFTGYNSATTSVDSPATVDGCGAGSNGRVGGKCKKAKKKRHKHHRAAESKKKHKKRSCKKKKKHKKHHR